MTKIELVQINLRLGAENLVLREQLSVSQTELRNVREQYTACLLCNASLKAGTPAAQRTKSDRRMAMDAAREIAKTSHKATVVARR